MRSRAEADELHAAEMQRRRSRNKRKAGVASGVARRKLAAGRPRRGPRPRTRALALALAYPKVRQVTREDFERRYAKACDDVWNIRVSERGLLTAYAQYRAIMGAYRKKGQAFETTNPRLARALELRGRARCPRTVQRQRKRLADMGLLTCEHVRRGRATPGHMDSLRLTVMRPTSFVTLPTAAGAAPLRGPVSPACALPEGNPQDRETALVAPPDGGMTRLGLSKLTDTAPAAKNGFREEPGSAVPPATPSDDDADDPPADDWAQSLLAGWGYAVAGGDG